MSCFYTAVSFFFNPSWTSDTVAISGNMKYGMTTVIAGTICLNMTQVIDFIS